MENNDYRAEFKIALIELNVSQLEKSPKKQCEGVRFC